MSQKRDLFFCENFILTYLLKQFPAVMTPTILQPCYYSKYDSDHISVILLPKTTGFLNRQFSTRILKINKFLSTFADENENTEIVENI
jgi:hypothetical protein